MKSKLLLLFLILPALTLCYGQFQKTVRVSNKHYHDLNIEPMNDGSNDYIVAGNLFDAPMQNEELTLSPDRLMFREFERYLSLKFRVLTEWFFRRIITTL